VPSNARRVHHDGLHLSEYILGEGTARRSPYLFVSVDDMIFIPFMVSKNIRAVSGSNVKRTTTRGGIFGLCLNHFSKQISWHHRASGTQEAQLEITEGRYRLVHVQFGDPGGELDRTPTVHEFPLQESRAYVERLGQGDERLRLCRQVQGMGAPHPIDGIECDGV
jgi:hypothetical protein